VITNSKILWIHVFLLIGFMNVNKAQAQWFMIKRLLQKEVKIVEETEKRLILYHNGLEDSLIFTTSNEPEADIYGDFEVRRGGNPYRVWVRSKKYWSTPRLFQDIESKFFLQSFSKTFRQNSQDIPQTLNTENQLSFPKEEPEKPLAQQPLPQETEKAQASSDSASTTAPVEKGEPKGLVTKKEGAGLVEADAQPHIEKTDSLSVSLYEQAEPPKAAGDAKSAEGEWYPRQTRKKFSEAPQEGALNPQYQNADSLLEQATIVPPQQTESAAIVAAAEFAQQDSLYEAALAELAKGNWEQAIRALEKLQALYPYYRDVAERLTEVRAKFTKTITPEPRTSFLFIVVALAAVIVLSVIVMVVFLPTMRARYYLLLRHYAAAAEIYEKLLANNPKQSNLYGALANLYLLLGRYDERAITIYKMILQLNIATPRREEINSYVAQHYLNEGRTDSDAIDVMENSLKTERGKSKPKSDK